MAQNNALLLDNNSTIFAYPYNSGPLALFSPSCMELPNQYGPINAVAWVTIMNPIPFLWYRAFTETSSICPTLPPPNMNFGSRSKVVVPITRLLLSLVVTATNILWSGFVFTSFSFALAGASRSCPRGKFSIYFHPLSMSSSFISRPPNLHFFYKNIWDDS